jgi:hypothetical protein
VAEGCDCSLDLTELRVCECVGGGWGAALLCLCIAPEVLEAQINLVTRDPRNIFTWKRPLRIGAQSVVVVHVRSPSP